VPPRAPAFRLSILESMAPEKEKKMRKFLIGAVLLFGAAACANKAQPASAPVSQDALAKAEMVVGGITNLTGTAIPLPSAKHNAGAASQPGIGETPTAPKLLPHGDLIPKR
jgi:hypothetical protein